MKAPFSPRRLGAMLAKEFIQMRRDRITFGMMLGVPLVQLALFGYAINTDPKNLPAALVAAGNGHYARAVVSALQTTGYYRFDYAGVSAGQADRLLTEGDVSFVVTIPSDFDRRVDRGDRPQILIEADATDPAARQRRDLDARHRRRAGSPRESRARAPRWTSARRSQLDIVVHREYNPEGISRYNIVPGLLGVILQLTMVMMTSMALTREAERGTLENLLAMPATGAEIMLGKVLPYLAVGAVQVVVVLVAAKLFFGVPFLGGLSLLLFAILAFVFGLVLLGYMISTFARSQMQAMQLTFFFFLPSLMLSGFMFPFRGMPGWAQTLGEIFPLTHFLRVVRAVMLKGARWPAVSTEVTILVGFIALFGAMALLRFRRTLD